MRISTNSIFDGSSARLSDLQSKMDTTSQQIASGRKILTPSDDPVASARALQVQQSVAINTQYGNNRLHVQNTLGVVDGALSSIVETLQSVHENVVGASNGILSDADRKSYATALQGQYDQLLALANSTDGAGHYVFAGNNNGTPPFQVQSATTVSYTGDTNPHTVQVDTERQMDVNVVGSELFPATSGADIFSALTDAIAKLNTPNTSATTDADLKASLDALGKSFDASLNATANHQSSVGIRLKELDTLGVLADSRGLQYAQTLSSLQDLDYNKALSDLSRQQLALQAAQKTFTQTSNLSLFNYIQ